MELDARSLMMSGCITRCLRGSNTYKPAVHCNSLKNVYSTAIFSPQQLFTLKSSFPFAPDCNLRATALA